MNEDRKRILSMLAEGKITADEAERLLDAMVRRPDLIEQPTPRSNGGPKYFRVEVNANDAHDGPAKVNVRIPMQLLRAGVRLSALIPPQARTQVNEAMTRQGIPFDLSQIKPENLDDLIEHLSEFTVDVDSEQAKVRVYCE
ncbi:MAG TPA: hypothetical protein VHW60_09635 [Caulobacteraceae bacterium]|jgi:hypothetical protein|nr:hypothetical protein [Caulobacteraceae bacterium]